MLKIGISFCSVSHWLIHASRFPAVTTVDTLLRGRAEMGWKCSLTLTPLNPWGQLDISFSYRIRKKPMFRDTDSKDLAALAGCVAGICHMEMPVQDMPRPCRSRGRNDVCANGKYGTPWSTERLFYVLLCSTGIIPASLAQCSG